MTRHAYYLTTRGPIPVRIVGGGTDRHPHRATVEVTADVGAYRNGHRMAVSTTFLVDGLPHRWSSVDDGCQCFRCGLDMADDTTPTVCDPYGVRTTQPTEQETGS